MNIYNIMYEKVVHKSVNKSNTEGKKFMCICLFSVLCHAQYLCVGYVVMGS